MHEEELKILSEHSLVQTKTEWKQKKVKILIHISMMK